MRTGMEWKPFLVIFVVVDPVQGLRLRLVVDPVQRLLLRLVVDPVGCLFDFSQILLVACCLVRLHSAALDDRVGGGMCGRIFRSKRVLIFVPCLCCLFCSVPVVF